MYRVFLLQRPGGQRHIDASTNVNSRITVLNRQLERKGKKKRDFWRLLWFSEHMDLGEARKLQNKMQRSVASPAALARMMKEHGEQGECELQAQPLHE